MSAHGVYQGETGSRFGVLAPYFARDPALEARFRWLREHASGIMASNYDISDLCNLRCEGCLYFSGDDRIGHEDRADDADWDRLFAAERRRGVNFAYLAGAEPSLKPARLEAAARHIGRGVVFTNGTRRIDERLPFMIHISLWGDSEDTATFRGGDNVAKAFRLYGGSARARFVMTLNAMNVDSAWSIAQTCHQTGSRLSFSLYSPTLRYRANIVDDAGNDDGYFRISTPDTNLIPGADDLARIHDTIEAVKARYPETVIYSSAYNRWVTNPAGLYDIDPVTGWARDCGTRRTPKHRHYRADLSSSASKCCSPNIDCGSCRAYSMASGTAVSRFRRFAATYEGFRDWLDISEQWARLFLRQAA